jgi:hypothetical protein
MNREMGRATTIGSTAAYGGVIGVTYRRLQGRYPDVLLRLHGRMRIERNQMTTPVIILSRAAFVDGIFVYRPTANAGRNVAEQSR